MGILLLAQGASNGYRQMAMEPEVIWEEGGLRGARRAPGVARQLREEAAALRALSTGPTLFVLHPNAAEYYLASGLRNPFRYDYPAVTTFGPSGQARVGEAIRTGVVREVCLLEPPWPTLEPAELVATVQRELRPVEGSGKAPCRLYRRP
jgi:hypothetical protein